MSQRNKELGFTVIELSLAMAFLAFILLFTTTTLVQMMRTYNKGLTIKQINQAGRTITEDLSRSLSSGAASEVNTSYLSQGKLCVGSATYIWNPVYQDDAAHTYNNGGYTGHKWSSGSTGLGLARTTSTYCRGGSAETLTANDNSFSLLGEHARIIDVDVEKYGVGDKLVQLTFVIGTFDPSEATAIASLSTGSPQYQNVYNTAYFRDGSLTCRPDNSGNFCAFGTFKTTVYVGN